MVDQIRNLLARAEEALRASRHQECLDICRRLLGDSPDNAEGLLLVTQAAQGVGDNGLADRAFRMLIGLRPVRSEYWLSYASFLRRHKFVDPAMEVVRELLSLSPELGLGWHMLGLCYFDKGDSEGALEAAQKCYAFAPERSEGWELAAAAQQRMGNFSLAIETCRTGLRSVRRAGRLHYSLGQLLRQNNDFAGAADAYHAAVKAGFTSPELYRNLAEALLDSGQVESAVTSAKAGVKRHPAHAGLHRTFARVSHAAQAPGDPTVRLRAAAEARKNDPALWQTLVDLLKRLDREPEASEMLAQARRLGCPDTPGILALEAQDACFRGEASVAMQRFESLLQRAPENPQVLQTFAELAVRVGEYRRASEVCELALKLNPHDQLALTYLGTAWQLLADPREHELLNYERMVRPVAVPTPEGFRDSMHFFTELRQVLDELHNSGAHPIEQSVRGGTQTNGFLFRLKHELLQTLEQQLRQAIVRGIRDFPDEEGHPFWSRKHRNPVGDGLRFAGAWSVRLRGQGFHTNHIHPQGWLSSALYVHLPPEVRDPKDTSGFIQFGQPMAELGLDLEPRRVVKPEVGTLVLFPSYMWHGTVPFESEEPRITVAFDLLPEGV